MVASGELSRNLGATLARMGAGYTAGVVLGTVCGMTMGAIKPVRGALEPVVSALNSTPKLVLLPMLMLMLGVGEAPKFLLIAASCFLTMAIQTMDAVAGVNPAFVEVATVFGAGRATLWRRVYLPSALPQIFTGLRLALGRALLVTISVELVSSQVGLGGMVWMAWQTFATEKLYVGVFVAAAVGLILHAGTKRLETRLIPWR